MNLKINQTMSSQPAVAKCEDSLKTAYLKMKRLGVRHLPVVDVGGSLAGIISDRDFQRAMWPVSIVDAHGLAEGPIFRNNATVAEYMSWPVMSLSHVNDLMTAVNMMIAKKISAVVITEKEEMIGILTHEDMLRVLAELLKKPESLTEKIRTFAYNSPIGKVSDLLANMGI